MERRTFLKVSAAAAAGVLASHNGMARAAARPNILWLTCEDMSPHLGCYGCAEARTPVLDALAAEGTRYTRAFSVAGVCAPSRSCLVSGRYPASIGSHHMRCKRALPPDFHCSPWYLREAGYYCTNNVKTDYNFDAPSDTWDEVSNKAHWRNRPSPDQPFFSVFNFTNTHESSLGKLTVEGDARRIAEPHDPAKMDLPPYYPDTPLIRQHWAHYFDMITLMDQWVGGHLRDLESDGLEGNTVVFFYSDHGVGFPRAKRWLYDSGLRVPLIIRQPGNTTPGTVCEDLVSFVDFGPTALSIAGIPMPEAMQGHAFLGEHARPPRQFVVGERDRMDERYDLIRAARNKRYKYIRNYEPFRAYDQPNEYQESWPVMQEMRRVQAAGKLTPEQQLYFRATKPLEELYDLETDPHELNNLVESPEVAEELAALRRALTQWMEGIRDLGLVPEMTLAQWSATSPPPLKTPTAYTLEADTAARACFGSNLGEWLEWLNARDPLQRLWAMRTIGLAEGNTQPLLLDALNDPQPTVVYWAAKSLGEKLSDTSDLSEVIGRLRQTLQHPAPEARMAAAEALLGTTARDEAVPVLLEGMTHDNAFVRLYAAQALERLAKDIPAVAEAMRKALEDSNEYPPRIARRALGMPPTRK